ncbi:hypothetical protein V6N12_023180 [Hibiscus sabdariffa]|uniref:Disease resistance protein RGA3 n=1 Tax=Hibiscus sabdariffa TaxID=183260 RepID=A0ABR2FWX6_9ROSI
MAAEGIAFDIAKGLVSLLSSSALEQLALWWNFKDDLEDLKSIVEGINAVLPDAEGRSVTNNSVKFWLKKVKDALYDAEDLLDDVDIEAKRKDLMSGNKLMKEVHVFFSSSNQFVYGPKMGREIKAIKSRFASIQNLAKELNLKQCGHPVHVKTPFMPQRREETHSFVHEGEIIGREDDKAALLELLLDREFQSEENVIILPIVGFGGLGKTALAQFVFNHERVKGHFKPMMWVTVSNVFDLKTIVANIIESAIKKPLEKNLEMDQLQKKLREEVDGKKYLLVLDDIWNENGERWYSLEKLLMGGARGSRIIVTTRSHTVAKITSGCEPHFLKGLSDDDAWSLFKKTTFKHRSEDLRDPAFLEIGKQISERRLRALELHQVNIKTVVHSIHKLKHLRYLDLSHNYYLKILPKSICKIQKLQVLKLEGCMDLEELPKKIEKLVNLTHLSLGSWSLTHMPSGIGKLTSLESLTMFVVDKDGYHGGAAADLSELSGLNNLRGELLIRNLGFVKNAREEFRAANLKEKQHLQSLVLQWRRPTPYFDDADDEDKSLEDLQPHPNLKKLRVVGWRGEAKFPSWLSLLTNLTVIEIRDCSKLKHLPSFAQLPHLGQLRIDSLTDLEYMEDSEASGGQGESESFFPSLTSLQLFYCPNLKSWWRKRTIDDHNNHDSGTEIRVPTMSFPCLSSLHIQGCPLTSMPLYPSLDYQLILFDTSWRPLKQTTQMNIAPSTSSLPLSKLKSLEVANIEELDPDILDECTQNKSLSRCLQQLTGLQSLIISDCEELDLEAMQWEPLKNLSHLEIHNIPHLVSLPLSFQHLTNLKELHLNNLPNLASVPDEMSCLTTLQVLKMDQMPQLEERCGKYIGADWHKIAHISEIEVNGVETCATGDLLLLRNRNQKSRLRWHRCFSQTPRGCEFQRTPAKNVLFRLIVVVHNDMKLDPDILDECTQNEYLSGWLQQLTSLKNGDSPPFLSASCSTDDEEKSLEDLQPHPNLKGLSVEGWNGDAKFPSWLSLLTNLVDIEIWGPTKFKHLPSFAQLPHLRKLRIDS